jgi:hypothetical protein
MDIYIGDHTEHKISNNITVEENKQNTSEEQEQKPSGPIQLGQNETYYKGNTDWMIKDIGEIDPNLTEYEKNVLLKGTYSVTDLLEKEKTEESVQEESPEKVFITKVKCIALHKLGYHPLTNPSNLTQREKNKIIKRMDKLLKDKSEEQITARFNKLVLDSILSENSDYTKYQIYNSKQ